MGGNEIFTCQGRGTKDIVSKVCQKLSLHNSYNSSEREDVLRVILNNSGEELKHSVQVELLKIGVICTFFPSSAQNNTLVSLDPGPKILSSRVVEIDCPTFCRPLPAALRTMEFRLKEHGFLFPNVTPPVRVDQISVCEPFFLVSTFFPGLHNTNLGPREGLHLCYSGGSVGGPFPKNFSKIWTLVIEAPDPRVQTAALLKIFGVRIPKKCAALGPGNPFVTAQLLHYSLSRG